MLPLATLVAAAAAVDGGGDVDGDDAGIGGIYFHFHRRSRFQDSS